MTDIEEDPAFVRAALSDDMRTPEQEIERLRTALADVRTLLTDLDLPMHDRIDNACTLVATLIEVDPS